MTLLTNIVSYWKLDETSLTTAYDATATANNGTETDITQSAANGKINYGTGFNGTTSKIALGTAIVMPTNVSITAWIKCNSTTGGHIIFADCSSDGNINWMLYQYIKTINLQWESTATDYVAYGTVGDVINDSNWHFICVTQSGLSAPAFYIDGSPVTSYLVASGGSNTKPTIGQGSVLGELGLANAWFFNGAIDEVGIWSRALASGEITSLWNGGIGLAYPFVTNQGSLLNFF